MKDISEKTPQRRVKTFYEKFRDALKTKREKDLYDMALEGASTREMADFVECQEAMLRGHRAPEYPGHERDRKIIKKARAARRAEIRHTQRLIMLSNNCTMAIYLGKVVLGQIEPTKEIKTNPQQEAQANLLNNLDKYIEGD